MLMRNYDNVNILSLYSFVTHFRYFTDLTSANFLCMTILYSITSLKRSCLKKRSAFGSGGPEPDRPQLGFPASGTGLGLDINGPNADPWSEIPVKFVNESENPQPPQHFAQQEAQHPYNPILAQDRVFSSRKISRSLSSRKGIENSRSWPQ